MASRKFTNQNKNSILLDWKNSPTNRGDTLYFITADVSAIEIEQLCFTNGVLVSISQVDNLISKITFVDLLT